MAFEAKPTIRRRSVESNIPDGNSKVTQVLPFGAGTIVTKGNRKYPAIKGIQETVSTGNPWRTRDKRQLQDIGGNFFTTRQFVEFPVQKRRILSPWQNVSGSQYQEDYSGPVLPVTPGNLFPTSIHSSNAALEQKGATAVARCKPTKSAAELGTALGELYKDGLPHLIGSQSWRRRTLGSREAGSEYLNVEFGWKPLANDVKEFLNGVIHAQKLLNQYERDAGRLVRRNYEFPIERTYTEQKGTTGLTFTLDQGYLQQPGAQGMYDRVTETMRKTWFSGAFTYHLPTGYRARKEMDRLSLLAKEVLGLKVTPEVLWNVAPWSWAIDWFSNTGDVISNVSDAANVGLIMRYGYIMEHTRVSVTYKPISTSLWDKSIRATPITYVTETKVRRRANPFGFGVSWSGLSPYQLSIAAALGISRR